MNTPALQKSFRLFREECIWLRCCYNTYHGLYESGSEVTDILSSVAKIFFGDLNRILIEYCWLQICKITDPAKSQGRENLTMKHIDSLLAENGLMTDKIKCCSQSILRYSEQLRTARNRLVSHLDKQSVMNGSPIGQHGRDEVEAFFEHLQEYVDAVGTTVGVGPLDFRASSGPGDVTDFLRKLRGISPTTKST